MQNIYTNPSIQRSFIQARVVKTELLNYLKISITDSLNTSTKEILVFPNAEYQFTFFDASLGTKRTLTGLVTTVYEDQIRIKYVNIDTGKDTVDCSCCGVKDCKNRSNNVEMSPTPLCNCILNPSNTNIQKYDEPKIYFIPIQNILDARYIRNSNDNPDTENNREGDIRIMLLGISATMVRSLIIRLDFIDDQIDEAVRYVDLKANGIYDLAYETNDGTIYESRVRVVKIEEVDDMHPCTPSTGFVREHVGCHSATYTACDHCCTKDDFIMGAPVKKVRIIVDTSEDFSGRYEAIMLHTIRDCKPVEVPSDDDFIMPDYSVCKNCCHKTPECHPDNCSHCVPPPKPPKPERPGCDCGPNKVYEYAYDNKYKVLVDGDKVKLDIRGSKKELPLEEIIKFYLGVD